MIFFGHLGITTGIVKTYEKALYNDKNSISKTPIDYRVVLVGSILPDIIDKPIGAYLLRSTFHNSRIFAHTLVFSVILLITGIYFMVRREKNKTLLFGICSSIHLILDSMWLYPSILFWPYFGWGFPERPEGNWIKDDIFRLISDPNYWLPEVIGFVIIAYYFIRLIKNKQIQSFIRQGTL